MKNWLNEILLLLNLALPMPALNLMPLPIKFWGAGLAWKCKSLLRTGEEFDSIL